MKHLKQRAFKLGFVMAMAAMLFCLIGVGTRRAEAATDLMKAVSGSSLEFTIKPGQGIHVDKELKLNDGFNPSDASSFILFYLSSEEPLLTTDGLAIQQTYGQNLVSKYPFTTNSSTSVISFDDTFKTTIEFDILADYALPASADEYEIVLYGMRKTYDSTKTETVRVATFKVSNNTAPAPIVFDVTSFTYDKNEMFAGKDTYLNITVKNVSKLDAYDTYLTFDFGGNLYPNYVMERIAIGNIKAGASSTQKIPVKVFKEAKGGTETVTVSVHSYNKAGLEQSPKSRTMYVEIGDLEEEKKLIETPNLVITTEDNYKLIKPGTNETIKLTLDNTTGERQARNIMVTCTEGLGTGTGITKNYLLEGVAADTVLKGKKTTVSIPLTIAESIGAGLHELTFVASYEDIYDNKYTSKPMTMYVKVPEKDVQKPADAIHNYINIKNVKQDPERPVAGETVTVTFDVVNNGNASISNVQVSGKNFSSMGFEPINSEPYKSVGTISAGDSKTVSMTFKVGEDIGKGLNTLGIGVSFINKNEERCEDGADLYILNVIAASDVGRPKLIVSDYSTGTDVLKAGDEFTFNFTLKNTHASKAASNIKLTISQAEGIFAPSTGTNIFYIEEIPAGGEETRSIALKTKADTSTGDYALDIVVEYEYDNMSEVDKKEGGVRETNSIKLHATENYRPVIENVYVASWDIVQVGMPVDLSLEFYNMGKSTLGNVYITIEGDFELANNSNMSYVGAVQGYGQEYINPSIVPLVGGMATGTVTVHFEDSNGDEVTVSQEFSTYVEDPMGGGDFGGFDDFGGMGDIGDFGGEMGWDDGGFIGEAESESEGFFSKIPWWGYVLAGVVVAGLVIVVAVTVATKKKPKKSRKQETYSDDEDF